MTFEEGPAEDEESSRFRFRVEELPEVNVDPPDLLLDLESSLPMSSKVNWLSMLDNATTSLPPRKEAYTMGTRLPGQCLKHRGTWT